MVPATCSEVTSQKNKSASKRVTGGKKKVEWKTNGVTQTPGNEAAQANKQTNENRSVCGRCDDLRPLNCDSGLTEVPAAVEWVTANRAGWVCVSVFVWVRKWCVPLSRKADSALAVSVACMPTIFSAQREQGDGPKPCSSRAVRKKKKRVRCGFIYSRVHQRFWIRELLHGVLSHIRVISCL